MLLPSLTPKEAAKALGLKKVILMQTDTILGLASSFSKEGALALRCTKKREEGKPFLLLSDEKEALFSWVNPLYHQRLEEAIQNSLKPTTFLVPPKESKKNWLIETSSALGKEGLLAVRFSKHSNISDLCKALRQQNKCPLFFSSSANLSSEPFSKNENTLPSFFHQKVFGFLKGKEGTNEPSSIINLLTQIKIR